MNTHAPVRGVAEPNLRSAKTRAERKNYLASMPKPKARGWLHVLTAPLALANGILLIVFAPGIPAKIGAAIFMVAAFLLFTNSGIYHLGNWSPKVTAVLRRIDHANIFLLIAGTYTPLSIMLLPFKPAVIVLSIVWGGAVVGSLMRIFWINAPRWLYVLLYIALGWVALWFLPAFWNNGTPAIVILVLAGGIAYTIGAMFYAFKWPNPWPRIWGFHEFFHVGTVIGFSCQAVAVWLTVFSV
ncbi:MAG: hemolysin III family protein [Actinomycetaceae bacterium]|nr:hemolysin III family protein [Actinomycetaceae bacterium]